MSVLNSYVQSVRAVLIVGNMSGECLRSMATRLQEVSERHSSIPDDFQRAFAIACMHELCTDMVDVGNRSFSMN